MMDMSPEHYEVALTVKGMEHKIIACLSEHEAELQEDIRRAVTHVVHSLDIRSEIEREARDTILQCIRSSVRSAVEQEVGEIVHNELAAAIKKAAADLLSRGTNEKGI